MVTNNSAGQWIDRLLTDRTSEGNADMPTMVAIADLTGQSGSGPNLLGVDVTVGILDVP